MFIGMLIRNNYKMWDPYNPYVKIDGPDLQITSGVITDPRFPDNMSGRIVDEVRRRINEIKL